MFARIQLPYEYNGLEPYIDAETVGVHYDGHHKTYMEKFNTLIKDVKAFDGMKPEEILKNLDKAPKDKQKGIKNNGGGFYNHNLYFESLSPEGKNPGQKLDNAVRDAFGSFEAMLEALHKAATETPFGSGYAWLIAQNGKLEVVTSPNQDLPEGNPSLLLPVDMWEHAYYLKHKNKKADYVKDIFNVINWEVVGRRFEQAE